MTFSGYFPVWVNKNLQLQIHAEGTCSKKSLQKIDFIAIISLSRKSYHISEL